MQAQLKEIERDANLKSYETVNPILKSGDFADKFEIKYNRLMEIFDKIHPEEKALY